MESPRGEARGWPVGNHRSRRTAAAALAEESGSPPPRAQMASNHFSLSSTCHHQHLLQKGEEATAGTPWAWTPAWPCLGRSLPNSFLLLAPPTPRWSVPSQRAERGLEGACPWVRVGGYFSLSIFGEGRV